PYGCRPPSGASPPCRKPARARHAATHPPLQPAASGHPSQHTLLMAALKAACYLPPTVNLMPPDAYHRYMLYGTVAESPEVAEKIKRLEAYRQRLHPKAQPDRSAVFGALYSAAIFSSP